MLRALFLLALLAPQGNLGAWTEDSYVIHSEARRLAQDLADRKAIAQARTSEATGALANEELLRLAASAPNETTLAAVEALLDSGADPDACCSASSGAALHVTTVRDNDVVASSLLTAGANVAPTDADGHTPLHLAAINNAARVAAVLLDEGADAETLDKAGSTALHLASEFGSAAVAKVLIDKEANVTATNADGRTPGDLVCDRLCPSGAHAKLTELFAQAVLATRNPLDEDLLSLAMSPANGSTADLMKALLDMGASADACCTELGGRALHATTTFDNAAAAGVLAARGADLETEDLLGGRPLHAACSTNALAVTKVLIAEGANAGALDHFSQTPLHVAAAFGRLEHCQALVTAGADRGAKSVNGDSPFDVICDVPCSDDVREALQLLLVPEVSIGPAPGPANSSADVEEVNGNAPESLDKEDRESEAAGPGGEDKNEGANFDEDLLHLASRAPEASARSVATKLLSKGADADACCLGSGATALHAAAEFNNDVVAGALIVGGADVNVTDDHGATPLHIAAVVDAAAVARLLIDAGADLEAANEDGDAPLHQAAEWGAGGVALLLVEAGADLEAKNGEGKAPADVLCEGLCEEGDREALEEALSGGEGGGKRPQELQRKLDEKLIEVAGSKERDSEKDATKLIARGASPDACCSNFGASALHATSRFDNAPVARVLVAADADVDPRDQFDHTPLHDAAISGAPGVAGVLLGAGAEVDPRDASGRTPLHLAAEAGNVDVAAALLGAGADRAVEDDDGMAPVDVVCATECRGKEAQKELTELLG